MTEIFIQSNIIILIECLLLYLFRKNFTFGLFIIFIDRMILRDCFHMEIFTSFFGLNFYTMDLLIVNCFVVVALRYKILLNKAFLSFNALSYKILLLIAIILIVNLVRGLGTYTTQAVWHAKHYIAFIAIVFYILSFSVDYRCVYRIFIGMMLLSGIIIAIAYLYYLGVFHSVSMEQGKSFYAVRVIDRDAIMLLIFTLSALFILAMDRVLKFNIITMILAGNCFIIIIASTLRAGWLCLTTSLLYLFFRFRSRLVAQSILICSLVLILVFISWGYLQDIFGVIIWGIGDSYETALYDQATSSSFRGIVNKAYWEHMGIIDLITGKAAGDYPYVSLLSVLGTEAGLHNQYLSFLYNSGIPGLALFILLNIAVLMNLSKMIKAENVPMKSTMEILVLGIVIYLPFNYVNTFDCLYPSIIGVAISIISSSESENGKANNKAKVTI